MENCYNYYLFEKGINRIYVCNTYVFVYRFTEKK